MVSSIVKLSVVPVAKRQHDGCIATLEGMLELARAGELVAVSCAAFSIDGATYTAFEPGDHTAALLGATARLQSDILAHLNSALEE